MARLHEIYVERLRFKNSDDPRPYLVVGFPSVGDALVVPGSSAWDLHDPRLDFAIAGDHSEFRLTGLKRGTYFVCRYPIRVRDARLTHRIGALGPKLSEEFIALWDLFRLRE